MLVNNFALECLWMDSGGGADYDYDLPNQIDTFNQFECDGPYQSHPANLIKLTGVSAQILFQNGQANGTGWSGGSSSNYPNPLIYVGEKTSGLSDSPSDVKFYGYTYEVGTQGLYVGEGAYNIHYDNSYIENVGSPLIVNGGAGGAQGITFSGNHIANSGNLTAIAQFQGDTDGGSVSGGMRDNFEYGGGVSVTTLAVCTGNYNYIDFAGNNINGGSPTTTNCSTSLAAPSSSTLTVTGGTSASVAADSTPITTITAAGVNSGKTLTLYATGTFSLATGGNINLGGYTSPLSVGSGTAVTLTLLDQTNTWTVTSSTGAGGTTGTTALATSSISTGTCQTVTAGSVNSSAATGTTTGSRILWTPAASLQTVTGYEVTTSGALSIDAYPTAGYVNFNVCNWSAGPITPGALTLNWKVE
jgi:hypothetical protein